MLTTKGYAVKQPSTNFEPFDFKRREVSAKDVLIKISHCGVCHSDIHQAKDEWGGSIYPMVPGHEIIGEVIKVGEEVKKFKIGDTVGVGCFLESCGQCKDCQNGQEQFCKKHVAWTYNGTEMDGKTPTYGGYSNQIVVNEKYVLAIAPNLDPAKVAPLLCAGITTYSPLKRFKVGKNTKVGIIGLGGLGHMGVKLAVAMGADVTVFSTSTKKEEDAKRFGAHHFVVTTQPKALTQLENQYDFILDTVSAQHDINPYLKLLSVNGVMALVGVPPEALELKANNLIANNRMLAGSLIGGIPETQEMLDFCAKHNITSDIELTSIENITEAYDRTIKGDVRYRFVIDMTTL